MKENKELNDRIVAQWLTGKYQTFSALARVMHQEHPKIIERAVKGYLQTTEIWQFHLGHPDFDNRILGRIFHLKPDKVTESLAEHQGKVENEALRY